MENGIIQSHAVGIKTHTEERSFAYMSAALSRTPLKKLAQTSETVNAQRPGSQLWLITAVRTGILGTRETAEKTSFNDLPLSEIA